MMHRLVSVIFSCVYYYIRPLVKWFLHRTTKLCELQRICYGEAMGSRRSHAIEYSLNRTRTPLMTALVDELNRFCCEGKLQGETGNKLIEFAVNTIIKLKKVDVRYHKDFIYPLTVSLAQIFGYKELIHEVEKTKLIPFSEENQTHEEKLLQLWEKLMPDLTLNSRISKQWRTIGFQGENPKTDFRGMGLLGLENLLYFASEYNGAARHVLSHSQHPQYGYSFAIVGINLTSLAYELLVNGSLKTHFFNLVHGRPGLKHFHQVYTYLFYEFDRFWLTEHPKDIMEFSRIRDAFNTDIVLLLKKDDAVLRLNFAVDTI